MEWFIFMLCFTLTASLLQTKTISIVPTNRGHSDASITRYTLQGYINRSRMYNSYNMGGYNNSKLLLLPGKHVLQTDFIIQNAYNFAIYGNHSEIYCDKSYLGIAFTKVTNVALIGTEITNCGKSYVLLSKKDDAGRSAIYFNQCTDVNVSTVHITVHSGTNGMTAVNIKASKRNKLSIFQSITITANCETPLLNGIVFYYFDHFSKFPRSYNSKIQLSDYKYKNNGLCKKSFALNIAANQTLFNVSIEILNTNFTYLDNSGILKYHTCGSFSNSIALYKNVLLFKNCNIKHNQGNNKINLFDIVISTYEPSNSIRILFHERKRNSINIEYCAFVNNSNVKSILHVLLLNSLSVNSHINIRDSIFADNYHTQIVKIKSEVKILWQMTHLLLLSNTRITSNRQSESSYTLISSANGLVIFRNSVIIRNNTYQLAIIQLYFSVLMLTGYSEFSANKAFFILDSVGGSYCILTEYSKINITMNSIHSIEKTDVILNDESKPMCFFQFLSNQTDYVSKNRFLHYNIDIIDNIFYAPKGLVQNQRINETCAWLKNTAFSSINSSIVYSKIIQETIKYANKSNVLMTNLSTICPCINKTTYNCSQRYIGTVFPGQTLTIKLRLITVKSYYYKTSLITSFSRTKGMPKACYLLDTSEIVQEHANYKCVEHNYTIWSELRECELYLSAGEAITEMLYVRLRACPGGFALHKKKKACSCDSSLYPYIISCNLNDETILRSANSWISAYQVDQKYEYKISKSCPYKHCLPHSSHLNLSMPDSQCQFHRTGLLCGKCQQGLSTIFGSSQCKHCSNFYLFIIIPIAIAGLVLVMMMFIFNLTVTSGIINTFIFYVNIISINYSTFFPVCHSIDCLLLSLSNLDLGFETCFYNGMDGYFKALLQLVFPLYLIFIAFMLIISSRYSATIQKITSRRGLHVLATIFLLSYTKCLLTVCQVLFFYSEIIHLPSKHTALVWSLDVSVPLFGVKFLIAFLICLIVFIILLHFNILLLFARQLQRFKYINTFKPLLDAYFGPYEDQFFYWTGLQLILRAVFFGLNAFHRNVNLTGGIIILGILICLEAMIFPFRSRYKNIQEALVILNLHAVYALALYSDDDGNANVIMQVLILLVLGYFFIIVSYHCLMSISTCSRVILKVRNKLSLRFDMLKDKILTSKSTSDATDFNGVNNSMSGNYHELQESLIALDI